MPVHLEPGVVDWPVELEQPELAPGETAAIAAVAAGLRAASVRTDKGVRAHALFRQRFTKAANCAKLASWVETVVKE